MIYYQKNQSGRQILGCKILRLWNDQIIWEKIITKFSVVERDHLNGDSLIFGKSGTKLMNLLESIEPIFFLTINSIMIYNVEMDFTEIADLLLVK